MLRLLAAYGAIGKYYWKEGIAFRLEKRQVLVLYDYGNQLFKVFVQDGDQYVQRSVLDKILEIANDITSPQISLANNIFVSYTELMKYYKNNEVESVDGKMVACAAYRYLVEDIENIRVLRKPNIMGTKSNPLKVVVSYAHKDVDVLNNLKDHFKFMERAGLIAPWDDSLIEVGSDWNEEIATKIKEAEIIILLISAKFFASDYIWDKELPLIEEKISNKSAIVFPILCRHCDWRLKEPFKTRIVNDAGNGFKFNIDSLQGLPIKNGKLVPIHSEEFKFEDEAYEQIATKLQELIKKRMVISKL
jgi:hypothetical protein